MLFKSEMKMVVKSALLECNSDFEKEAKYYSEFQQSLERAKECIDFESHKRIVRYLSMCSTALRYHDEYMRVVRSNVMFACTRCKGIFFGVEDFKDCIRNQINAAYLLTDGHIHDCITSEACDIYKSIIEEEEDLEVSSDISKCLLVANDALKIVNNCRFNVDSILRELMSGKAFKNAEEMKKIIR